MFERNYGNGSKLEYENKQLKLQLETTLDQSRQFQLIGDDWKRKYDELTKRVTTFCSCITSLEYAKRQIGGHNQVSKMSTEELLSFSVEEYNKQKKEFQDIAIKLSNKLDEKDRIIESLKAQISIYEIEKARPPYISNEPYELNNGAVTSEAPSTPSVTLPDGISPDMIEDLPLMDDLGLPPIPQEFVETTPKPKASDNTFVPPMPPVPSATPKTNAPKTYSKNKNTNTNPTYVGNPSANDVLMVEEDIEALDIDPNSAMQALQADVNTYVGAVRPAPDTTNANTITNEKRAEIKQRLEQENEQKMHMIDINPLIIDVQNNDVSMSIFKLIGEKGLSQLPQIVEQLSNTSLEKGGKTSINAQITSLVRSKVLSRTTINTGYRRFTLVDFTTIGVRIFEEIFKKSPVESERHRLTRENASAEHGYLIQDTMTILKKEFGYVNLIIDRKMNTIKLGNNRTYIPDIVATIDGKNWDYIEVERGTHTQKDFNDKLNKMRMVTKTFYFVSQNQEMLNVVMDKTNKWIEEIGPDALQGITIKFSTLSHLAKRSWSKIISL